MSSKLEIRKSPTSGRGCFALVPFRKRQKIAAYDGELLRGKRKIEARIAAQDEVKVIWITDGTAIDGAAGGNETAYLNHSCDPNAFMRAASRDKVLFFALKDIPAGAEITIDYRNPENPPSRGCKCGAANCRSARQRKRRVQKSEVRSQKSE